MAATIQQIVKPTRARALDTSGNNNHAQIYSGRALEFDGVTDYFTNGTAVEGVTKFAHGKEWTFSCWLYFSGTGSQWYVGKNQGTTSMLQKHGDESLGFRQTSSGGTLGDAFLFNGSTGIELKTWYRQTVICNGTTLTCYLNGEIWGAAITPQDTQMYFSGWGTPYETGTPDVWYYHMDGWMSDGQVWDKAWTADDVTFDYLNPEELALNRSGTSLTNSNLKLWYPMNEGHRGNQSFILDASNTGLGDEMVVNGDFETGSLSPFVAYQTEGDDVAEISGKYSYSGGNSVHVNVNTSAEGIRYLMSAVAGTTYKMSIRVYHISGAAARINPSDAQFGPNTALSDNSLTNQWQLIEGFWTCHTTANANIYLTAADAGEFYFDDFSIKPINNKHNATTVFFGDNTIVAGNNDRDMGGSNNWDAYGTGTSESVTGGKLRVVTTTANAAQGAELPLANSGTPVAGRTYRIRVNLKRVSGLDPGIIHGSYGGSTLAAFKASDGSPSNGEITDSEEEYYLTLIAINATGKLIIANPANTTALTFEIDDAVVEEVGVASGWTDADQQLDIPQVALQSYNQLAYTITADSPLVTITDGTTSQITTNNHSIAFWCFLDDEDPSGFHYLVEKGVYETSGWYIYANGVDNPYIKYVTNQSGTKQAHTSDTTLVKGKWNFVVVTVENSGQKSIIYFNGDEDSTTGDTYHTAPVADATPMHLGSYSASTHPGNHVLTELSSWNKTLSRAETQELWNDGLALDATTHSASANLVGYWRNNGLAQWEDLSTNDYHGVVTGYTETMLITAGVDGSRDSQGFLMNRQRTTNSLNLPSAGNTATDAQVKSYVKAINKPDNIFDGGGSVSWWMKSYSPGENNVGRIFDVSNDTSGGEGFCVLVDADPRIVIIKGHSTTAGQWEADTTINHDNWHHIVITYNDDAVSNNPIIYVNGTASAITEVSTPVGDEDDDSAQSLMIGNNNSSTQRQFDGLIDDVAWYSDILTATEVTRNYKAGKRSHK